MKRVGVLVLLAMSGQSVAYSQELFCVGKAGVSSYGSVNFSLAGGGDQSWALGPIVGAGVRIRTSRSFAIESLIEYSTYRYKVRYEWDAAPVNAPRNSILELSAVSRVSLYILDVVHIAFLGGMAASWHQKDEVIKVYPSYRSVSPGRRAVDIGAILGAGVEARISRRIELTLDGTWRMRFYVTPVVQLGVAYSI